MARNRVEPTYIERLQKQLAVELPTEFAATPITRTTRLPGFLNYKNSNPHLVRIEYRTRSGGTLRTTSQHSDLFHLLQLAECRPLHL